MKRKSFFDRLDDVIIKAELYTCYAMFAIMILSIFGNAVFRMFGEAIDWSTDLAQLMFVWVSIIGADLAMKKSRHVGVDLLTRKLPKRVSTWLMILIYVAACVFLGTAAYFGTGLALQNSKRMFNTLPISYSWVTIAIPVGFVLILYTLLRHIFFLALNRPDYYEDKLEDLEELEAL